MAYQYQVKKIYELEWMRPKSGESGRRGCRGAEAPGFAAKAAIDSSPGLSPDAQGLPWEYACPEIALKGRPSRGYVSLRYPSLRTGVLANPHIRPPLQGGFNACLTEG
jgi:hypothetical protein